MEEKKKGGVRPNSGRKKVGDKKVQFVVYVPKSWIPKEAGDVMRLRERVVDFIESDRNPVLSQNKPVEGNVRETKESGRNVQKNASAVKIQDLTNQSKTNYSINTTGKPERMQGESGIDYSIRLAEWKQSLLKIK